MNALLFLMTATVSFGSSNKIFIIDAFVKVITKIMANFLNFYFIYYLFLWPQENSVQNDDTPLPPPKK